MKKLIILAILPIVGYGQTTDQVYKELVKQNVLFPEIVLAQSILETGWYKCTDCSRDVNNIFGLWNSRKQEYFSYDKWQDSVGGYLRGIQYKYKEEDYNNYYEFLEKLGYAEDPNYIDKLKKLVK